MDHCIAGSIPGSLGGMEQMEILYLSHNQLSGEWCSRLGENQTSSRSSLLAVRRRSCPPWSVGYNIFSYHHETEVVGMMTV